MFGKNFENAASRIENTGSRFEDQFIGTVNRHKYKEMAYDLLNKKSDNFDSLSKDDKFEEILKRREHATQEFENTLDFKEKYISRNKAMELVEKCQTGDPEHPSRFFASKLYETIKNRFNGDELLLKFFTATGGTHLDVTHKIDCYFKLYLKKTGEEVACATLDLTQRSNKDTAKANVLVNISPEDQERCDPSKNNDRYDPEFLDETINKLSEKILQALINDYRERKGLI